MASLMTSSHNNHQLFNNNTFNQASLRELGEPQLSPRKALRVAMLKTRYSDIIFKAKEMLNIKGERKDEAKVEPKEVDFIGKQEINKRRFECQVNSNEKGIIYKTNSKRKPKTIAENDSAIVQPKKEEINRAEMQYEIEESTEYEQRKKRKIVARVKIAKHTIDKANLGQNMKIEKEREASRLRLEKVEASIYIDDFSHKLKEFMALISFRSNGSKA